LPTREQIRPNEVSPIVTIRIVVVVCLALTLPTVAQPTTTLKQETLEAFERYTTTVEDGFREDIRSGRPLWLTDVGDRARVREGTIAVRKAEDVPKIPGGLIHQWSGAFFLQGETVHDVIDLLTDYDRHKEIYPEVVDSKLLQKQGNRWRSLLRLKKVKVITVVLNTEHETELILGVGGRQYLFSHSTRIAEVRNAGKANEQERPVGKDGGFLWRLNAYWALEADQNGVWVECTTISLSRRIPWGLGWLVQPIVQNMPREALEETLRVTRATLITDRATRF
jgi:hypothetical protein